jgi:hypothetical protein
VAGNNGAGVVVVPVVIGLGLEKYVLVVEETIKSELSSFV